MAGSSDENEAEAVRRRPSLSKLGKKKPTTIRGPTEEQDEIDERELDQVSGGRMHRVEF